MENEVLRDPVIGVSDQRRFSEEDLKQDVFYYMPEELWPEEATVVRKERCYLWYRRSEWKKVEAVNENNKRLIDKYIKFYNDKEPEILDVLHDDKFWFNCVGDALISNSIRNRDYIYELDYENDNDFKRALKQYDVVFQETIGGFVCHPYVVFDIEYRNAYEACIKYDDYAEKELNKINGKYAIIDNKGNNAYDKQWSTVGYREYIEREIQLIKDSHATYMVKPGGTEYRMKIRWIDRSNHVTPQPYGLLKKDIW